MKALRGFVAVIFSCVLIGGIYIGSAILGYFLAALSIILAVVGVSIAIVCGIAYVIYELIGLAQEK